MMVLNLSIKFSPLMILLIHRDYAFILMNAAKIKSLMIIFMKSPFCLDSMA